jgi:tRNA-2-methylthio-N6-dimethylallyladenosine synthase
MNSADSTIIKSLLITRGFTQEDKAENADVIIVNTCSIREKAENRAFAVIQEYAAIKKKDALLWVVGCMAQRIGEELRKKIPSISQVIGALQIEFIEEKIDEYLLPLGNFNVVPRKIQSRWSSYVPIMRGCNNYCSYCIVPFVRGREHSLKSEEICSQAQKMVDNGASEVVLLGQNVNSYNDGTSDFSDLMAKVAKTNGLRRIRFMVSHPKDINIKLVQTISETPNVCKHIHLPVQSGNSTVLEKMNRNYTREQYLEKIAMIREIIPDCDITTDALVGFPGETDTQFADTLSLFEQVRFAYAYMFAYSPRVGTAASEYKSQIPQKEKLQRLAKLIEVNNSIVKDIYLDTVGQELDVLFIMEQDKKNTHSWVGLDFKAKWVLVDTNENMGGKIAKVKVLKSSGMTLVGELV